MNVDKGGFPQTLYNIFSFINPEDLLFITSLQAYKIASTSPPFTSRTLTYNIEIIPVQKNRTGKYINRFIQWFDYSVSENCKGFNTLKSAIKKFNPEVVIVAPNGTEGVFIYHKLKTVLRGIKVFPYFMDDWLYQTKLKWINGNINRLVKKMLTENNAWFMISKNLADILSERYNAKPARVLHIHNPVDVSNSALQLPFYTNNEFTIAYAGALWPMHFDALLVMAKAINILKTKRKINLIIYTAESNWNWRKTELETLNVVYGGYIPYKEIHIKLSEADCLLVTSSFSEKWQTHTKGSVQTKITDYMKAARLIIACGPAYAANHHFLKQYNCGICIETNIVAEAAKQVNTILNNIEHNEQYIINGIEALKNHFSFEAVHQRFKDFLAA